MKQNIFQISFFSMLIVISLLLTASQQVMAAKPVPSTPVVIDEVVVDYLNGQIVVTGSGFNTVTDVLLGGTDVTADRVPVSSTSMLLGFSNNMASAVPGPGNYSLSLDGNAFSVYFSLAIYDPGVGAVCPCQSEWAAFRLDDPPDGFAGVDPSCNYASAGDETIGVEFLNLDWGQIWVLTSEFLSSSQTGSCALVIDGATQNINYPQHLACTSYLKGNYFSVPPGGNNCLFFAN